MTLENVQGPQSSTAAFWRAFPPLPSQAAERWEGGFPFAHAYTKTQAI